MIRIGNNWHIFILGQPSADYLKMRALALRSSKGFTMSLNSKLAYPSNMAVVLAIWIDSKTLRFALASVVNSHLVEILDRIRILTAPPLLTEDMKEMRSWIIKMCLIPMGMAFLVRRQRMVVMMGMVIVPLAQKLIIHPTSLVSVLQQSSCSPSICGHNCHSDDHHRHFLALVHFSLWFKFLLWSLHDRTSPATVPHHDTNCRVSFHAHCPYVSPHDFN